MAAITVKTNNVQPLLFQSMLYGLTFKERGGGKVTFYGQRNKIEYLAAKNHAMITSDVDVEAR